MLVHCVYNIAFFPLDRWTTSTQVSLCFLWFDVGHANIFLFMSTCLNVWPFDGFFYVGYDHHWFGAFADFNLQSRYILPICLQFFKIQYFLFVYSWKYSNFFFFYLFDYRFMKRCEFSPSSWGPGRRKKKKKKLLWMCYWCLFIVQLIRVLKLSGCTKPC